MENPKGMKLRGYQDAVEGLRGGKNSDQRDNVLAENRCSGGSERKSIVQSIAVS